VVLVGACFKGDMSDSVTNYSYIGNTKVSESIKKTNANKCTLSEIFLTEILKIILSVLIGAGNPELLSTVCLLSATIQI